MVYPNLTVFVWVPLFGSETLTSRSSRVEGVGCCVWGVLNLTSSSHTLAIPRVRRGRRWSWLASRWETSSPLASAIEEKGRLQSKTVTVVRFEVTRAQGFGSLEDVVRLVADGVPPPTVPHRIFVPGP